MFTYFELIMRLNLSVLTIYSKAAGKGGRYGWIESATNISGVSYALIQLWEYWGGREFQSIVKSTASFHAYCFIHLPWQRLLYVMRPKSVELLSSERMKLQ